MPSTASSILGRYLDKVIQDNKAIDARGVMQVNRMIELSMEDVFIHLTLRMNRPDKWSSLLDTINLSHTYSESDLLLTRKPLPRVPEILWPSYSDYGETEKGVSTDALWQRHYTWVLLGDPGAGKTTLLKHFAVQEAKAYKTGEGYLPVFLPLRLLGKKLENHFWVPEEAILNYLTEDGLIEMGFADEQERQALRDSFQSALASGRALLLLDGLDELRDHHVQKRTVQAIESLHRLYPGNRFAVTSRIVGYDAAPLSGAFHTATLEPFTDEQMSQFFQRWCYAVEKNEDIVDDEHTRKRAEDKAAQLIAQIKHNPGIRLLAANPLLCTIIGLIQRQGATLPELRVELYKLCIDTFIFNWEMRKRQRSDQDNSLDKDQTQKVLEEIALQLHEHFPENRIPRDQLTGIVSRFLTTQQGMAENEAAHKAGQLLNLIRDVSGLLIDRGNEEYGFFHLTFQEYLAARAITRKKRDIDRYLSRCLYEPRWREVIRLAAAHQGMKDEESGSEFIEAILRQKHPRDDLMHYTFRFAFLCLKETKVELETSDRMFRQWITYFMHGRNRWTFLLQLLRQPGVKIRYRSGAIQSLILTLNNSSSDWEKRWLAAMALGEIGDKAAVEPLILALKDAEHNVCSVAAEALGKIGNEAIDSLILAIKNENGNIRWYATKALGEIGDKTAIDPLISALNDENPSICWIAAEGLGKMSNKAAINALIFALYDENSDPKWWAIEPLGEIGDKTAVAPLILVLKNKDSRIRSRAAEALGKIGDKDAIASLILAFKDEDWDVRSSVAKALGKIGDNAIDFLIFAIKDEDAEVRKLAAKGLREVDNKVAVDALILALNDEHPDVRGWVVYALEKIGDKTAVAPLILALNDEDWHVRHWAAIALGKIGEETVIAPLILTLNDEHSGVRSSAAEALGIIGDKAAVAPLILTLNDEHSDVRLSSAEALGKIGDKTAVAPLILALNDEDSSVRSRAAKALGKIGDKAAIDSLINSLQEDRDWNVRELATQAIEEIDLGYRLCPD